MLLHRNEFKEKVFKRDKYKCVICQTLAVDAHHIMERRLFIDYGYYIDNGVSLCSECHIKAEDTTLSCKELRDAAGITNIIMPPTINDGEEADKWGNIILPNKMRLRGELFYEEGVQKILNPYLSLFTNIVKFPRTFHLDWSPNLQNDDKRIETLKGFYGEEVIVTIKMDGENTTTYKEYIHARSLDYSPREDRAWMKAFHASFKHEIPEGWRICGENLYAEHSIHYDNLEHYFQVFSIWNEKNECLSWDETKEWCELLGLTMVHTCYRGPWDEEFIRKLYIKEIDGNSVEGYVVRVARKFSYRDYRVVVGKYVREGHIQTDEHWTNKPIIKNGLRKVI